MHAGGCATGWRKGPSAFVPGANSHMPRAHVENTSPTHGGSSRRAVSIWPTERAPSARSIGAPRRSASLALAGTGAAILADGGSADAAAPVSSTRYVVVTGPTGTRTYAVTVTTKGKKQTILRVVRKPGGGTTTLRDTVSVDGPTKVLPGKTIITKSPPKTVTVKGPAVTVTETETQVLTETVTLINDVTVTVEVPSPPIPSP
jgi:hypothetical protein